MLVEIVLKFLSLIAIIYIMAKFLCGYLDEVFKGAIAAKYWPIHSLEEKLLNFLGNNSEYMNLREQLISLITVILVLVAMQAIVLLLSTDLPVSHVIAMAVSFSTGTNWQSAGSFEYLTMAHQLLFIVANFVSSSLGLAVSIIFIAGISNLPNKLQDKVFPNFYLVYIRSLIFVIAPLCIAYIVLQLLFKAPNIDYLQLFEAIKIIGVNGGGYDSASSAHPFVNPNVYTNYIQIIGMSLLPIAIILLYAKRINRFKHGEAVLGFIFLAMFVNLVVSFTFDNGDQNRELRFSEVDSLLNYVFSVMTSGNAIMDVENSSDLMIISSFSSMLAFSSIIGGLGNGIINLFFTVLMAIFFTSLMAGRSPEFIGKKIDSKEIGYIMIYLLIYQASIILITAFSLYLADGETNYQLFADYFYIHVQASLNNGMGFASFAIDDDWINYSLAVGMLTSKLALIVCGLFLAERLGVKRAKLVGSDDVELHQPFFIFMMFFVIFNDFLVFVPNYLAGPIAYIFGG